MASTPKIHRKEIKAEATKSRHVNKNLLQPGVKKEKKMSAVKHAKKAGIGKSIINKIKASY